MARRKISLRKNREHDFKSYPMWIAIIGFMLSLTTLCIIIGWTLLKGIPMGSDIHRTYQGWLGLLWFDNLQTFTILGNLLVMIFWITYLCGVHTTAFNDNRFTYFTCSYIGMVGFMYWTILVPINGSVMGDITITSYLTHAVTPLLFLVFTLAVTFYNKKHYIRSNKKETFQIKYWRFIGYGIIFPVCYVWYLIIINFIPLPDYIFNTAVDADGHANVLMSAISGSSGRNYISVYGSITNFNALCLKQTTTEFGTISYDSQSGGSWMNLLMVCGIILLIPAIQFLLAALNNLINRSIINQSL